MQIKRDDESLMIQVDDDGSGIAQNELGRAVQRGERPDATAEGHGLGLAIVSDKVDAYLGTLTLDRSQLGGLQVRILLPWPVFAASI